MGCAQQQVTKRPSKWLHIPSGMVSDKWKKNVYEKLMFWHRLSALSIRTLHPSTLFNRTGVLAQNCLENIPTGRTNFFSFFPIHAYYLSEMKLKADRHLCGKSESLLCRMAVLMMVMMSTQEPPL